MAILELAGATETCDASILKGTEGDIVVVELPAGVLDAFAYADVLTSSEETAGVLVVSEVPFILVVGG